MLRFSPTEPRLITKHLFHSYRGKVCLSFQVSRPILMCKVFRLKVIGEFTILSVNHQNNYLQNLEDSPEVKSIRSQIDELQIKVTDENAAINVLKQKEAFLTANNAVLVKTTTFSLEQFKNFMDLYTNNMDQIAMTSLKKDRLIKDYNKQISALQKQIADKLGKQQLPSGEILVSVTTEKTGNRETYFQLCSSKCRVVSLIRYKG